MPTPRTDALLKKLPMIFSPDETMNFRMAMARFARELEEELAEANKQLDALYEEKAGAGI